MKTQITILFYFLLSAVVFPQTAEEYLLMADSASQKGDIVHQIMYSEKAISIFEHENNFNEYFLYATLFASRGYMQQKNFNEAIGLLENCRRIYPDKEIRLYPVMLSDLAACYKGIKFYDKTEALLFEVLSIIKKIHGTEHPDYATNLCNLAGLYESMGHYSKAESLYLEAIEIQKKTLGPEDPAFAKSLNNLGCLYHLIGKYSKAEPLYLEAMEIRKKILGPDDPDYAQSLNNLGYLYYAMGNYSKAELLYLEAMEIYRKSFGPDDPHYATSLVNLGLLYESMRNYSKTEPLYLEALEIVKKALGPDDPDYARSLNNLASLYQSMGNYSKAEPLYLEALEIVKKALGPDDPDYARSLNNLASLYQSMGNYCKAEPLYLEAMEIRKKILGPDDPDYATSMNNLALLYASMGNYTKAEPLYFEAMEIRKKVLGTEDTDYAQSLNNLGSLYHAIGKYSKAVPLYLEAMEIRKKVLGTEDPDYAQSLNNLGSLYESMGNYSKAEQLYLEAMEIRKKILGPDDPDYATSLNNLGGLYKSMGNFGKAEQLYLEATEIWKKILGPDNRSYATSLNNLGMLYESMGNYSKAEPLYLEAMEIWKKILGPDNRDYATSLNNLGMLYQSMGNYSKAEPFYLEAMEIWKKVLGPNHPDYALSLNNLAGLYESMGNYSKAEPLYLEAMEIVKKALGLEHSNYATCLNNLAGLYESMGNFSKAESIYLEALEIVKKALGLEHSNYATCLNNLGGLHELMGNYSKAEPLLLEAKEILKKALGPEHLYYAFSLCNLGKLHAVTGDNAKAVSLCDSGMTIMQKNVRSTFSTLSETEKIKYTKKYDRIYNLSISALPYSNNNSTKNISSHFLFRKGLVLNSSVNTRSFILNSNDAALKQKYTDWLSTKQVINNLYSKTIEQRKNSGYYLDSLEEAANTLEKELSRMSSTFKDFVMIPDFKWEDVRKNLEPGEAVVDLVKYRLYDKRWTDTTRYGVFITKSDSEEPVYFEFKDGNRIDTLIIPKLNEMNRNKFADASKTEEEDANVIMLGDKDELDFYSELFAPMAEHLKDVKKIYFSLDGEFYKVNFNTLRNPATGKYLIEDYDIIYVSSANEIARGKRETPPNKTAVLTGFPNYDLSLDSLTALVKAEQTQDQSRDIYVNTSKMKQYNIDLLPGTKDEVTITGDLLKKNGWEVSSLLFNDATESKVKSITAPGLLSISTHGFFSPSPKTDYSENYFMGTETKKAVENPLLRSGLFLTGAETFLNSDDAKKEEFSENGILTAYEASQMNLLGTDLVILSACETGLGEVNNGEGVFGLQRGFFGAGAKSVMMSLWKVDDAATKDLMIEFIKNYSTTMDKQKSLRDAQITIMKKYPQPYYWGAFVMVGM